MRPSRSRELIATLVTGMVVLGACGDDDAAGPAPTGPAVTDMTSPAPTPAPTDVNSSGQEDLPAPPQPSTPTATATATPDGTSGSTAQTFIVAPQEPRQVTVGGEAEFSVGATYDGSPVPDRLWLGAVPCEHYDFEAQTFAHAEATAEGFDSDFGPRVHRVDGERYENVDDIWPTEVHVPDGVLEFSLVSERQACAIPTVFQDTNDNGELDVDDGGIAVEPYGVGKATWS